jgi:hypothetical protein
MCTTVEDVLEKRTFSSTMVDFTVPLVATDAAGALILWPSPLVAPLLLLTLLFTSLLVIILW